MGASLCNNQTHTSSYNVDYGNPDINNLNQNNEFNNEKQLDIKNRKNIGVEDSTYWDTVQNQGKYAHSLAYTDISQNPLFINLKDYDTNEELKKLYNSILNFDEEHNTETKENYNIKSENNGDPEHLMISGSSDKFIKIWNYGSECIHTLKGHDDYIRCVISLNENTIASGSADKTVKIWNWRELNTNTQNQKDSSSCIKTLNGHTDTVNSIICLNESQIVSAGLDRLIKIWDWKKGTCLNTIEQEFGHVNCLLKISPIHFLSGGYDLSIELWESLSGKCEKELKGHSLSVTSLISLVNNQSSNSFIASGSWDNTIKIWTLDKEECLKTLIGHNHYVTCLIQLNERKHEIASSSFDSTIRIWNWKEGTCSQVLEKHNDWVHCLVKLNDSEFASGGHDKQIIIWNSQNKTKTINKIIEDHSASVHCLSVINIKLNYFNLAE